MGAVLYGPRRASAARIPLWRLGVDGAECGVTAVSAHSWQGALSDNHDILSIAVSEGESLSPEEQAEFDRVRRPVGTLMLALY